MLLLLLLFSYHLHRLFQNAFDAVSIKEAEKMNDGENVDERGHRVLVGAQETELGEEVFHIFLLDAHGTIH